VLQPILVVLNKQLREFFRKGREILFAFLPKKKQKIPEWILKNVSVILPTPGFLCSHFLPVFTRE